MNTTKSRVVIGMDHRVAVRLLDVGEGGQGTSRTRHDPVHDAAHQHLGIEASTMMGPCAECTGSG
ncbi:MAG: hypothetical protein JWL64_534 [Frankiales bacterium]|nr:hypothetical protein [Frankiales bacterium]